MSTKFQRSRSGRRHRRRSTRLRLEHLETRRLLATLTVTSTLDAVDLAPGDGVCEVTAGGPCTLRAAIQEANALANAEGPDRIEIPAGTYTLSLVGVDDQAGDLDIRQSVVLEGFGSADTIIDAAGIDRVIDVALGTVTINGVTIRGGVIDDDDATVEGSGGGIRSEGDLTISDSVVSGNRAPIGAGVANYNGTLRIVRSVISGNGDQRTVRGGGIANYSNYDPANLEVTDSTIADNQATTGGGINNHSYDGAATATITRSTVSGNTASVGGGISNRSVVVYYESVSSNLTILGSTISGNVADDSGGGIHNEADVGGDSRLGIANTTIAANTASGGDGGGIRDASPNASTTFESVILAGNAAGGSGPDLSSSTASGTLSLIQSGMGHSITDGNDGNIVGQDPLLGPLADNGGPTQTHLLGESSVAIDQGSNSLGLASDQRGNAFARTIDDLNIGNASDGTDIGAVEVGQAAATLDFGDAPEGILVGATMRQYPTGLSSNGARHRITEGGPWLGSLEPDGEPDGQSTASATGDDLVGIDDEDAFGSGTINLTPGASFGDLSISHDGGPGGAFLNAWIDLNLDGDWNDPGEQILSEVSVPAGASSTSLGSITLPVGTPSGRTFIRVRLSTDTGLTPQGEAMDGEVEDFAATIGAPPPQTADLSLTQNVSDNNPVLGQEVTFTITVANAGLNAATNIEVTSFLPNELIFENSNASQGQYDDLDGVWSLGNLGAGASAVLSIAATVDSTDPITNVAEITQSGVMDPDSTPGNGISGEDDQASITLGTCLAGGPVHVGQNRLTFSCALPGSISAFVFGTDRGSRTLDRYNVTVDIADAEVFALAVADSNGVATAVLELSDEEFAGLFDAADATDPRLVVQALEIAPGSTKSNTLAFDSAIQMLRASQVGPGALPLQREVLAGVIETAIATWDAAGVSAADLATMHSAHVTISQLPGDAIARVVGRTIVLSSDAAGNGWFVDVTPESNTEFSLNTETGQYVALDQVAASRIDLVTTLVHEFGHIIGLPDLDDPTNVMHGTLDVGVRRLPTTNTNRRDWLDVNDDDIVSALDALVVVNRLNRQSDGGSHGRAIWVGAENEENLYLDTNADFTVSALDALQVINFLGRAKSDVVLAEAIQWSPPSQFQSRVDTFRGEKPSDPLQVDRALESLAMPSAIRPAAVQTAPWKASIGAKKSDDSELLPLHRAADHGVISRLSSDTG